MNPSVRHDDQRFLGLLEKWQNGDFTRADEQALRTLTTSDDFRREAMEGFMSLPEAEHEARLGILRERLRIRSGRAGGGRRIALPQIWAAAAALALLLAAIWFFPTWNLKEAAPVAQKQVETSASAPQPEEAAPSAADDDGQIAMQQPVEKPAAPPSGRSSAAPNNQTLSGSSRAVSEPGLAAAEEKSEAQTTSGQSANTAVAPPQSPNAAPVRSAPAEAIALDKAVSESKKDNAAATRYKESAKLAKAKKRAPTADSTWHETDRKPDMEAERKQARDETQPAESEPAGGWEAFREYLRLNARLTPEARNNNASGTVRLQFSVNANGDPQGFVVLRSVGYGCDQEAIRLVQAWEWEHGKNPVVTVDVPFVR